MLKKYYNDIFPITIAISNDADAFAKYTHSDGTPWGTMPDHFGQKHKACVFRAFNDGELCSCIYLQDIDMSLGWTHEAFHATQLALEYLGIDFEPQGANETWAYMIEYVFGCIVKFVKENSENRETENVAK